MKKFFYAVYDMTSKEELCLGVWDSAKELCADLDMNLQAFYRNLNQTIKGRKFSRTGISVRRVRRR